MKKAPVPRVAVLIPAWNQVDELVACLESFSCIDYPAYEVVVVNNGTEDSTSEIVRRDYPWVTLIEEGVNLGFCKANNIGLRYCLKKGFDYVVLLNADTKVLTGFIGDLVRVMESDRKIGIAGAKNLLMEDPAYMWGQYGRVTWGPMLAKTVGRFEPDLNLKEQPKDVDWVICNGCIASRAALEKVGFFDEVFWQCHEDIDWSYRARAAGFRVVYVDAVAILHKGGSSANFSRKKVFSYGYFITRNAFIFAKKYASPLQMAKLFLSVWLGVAARFTYHLLIFMKDSFITMIGIIRDAGGQRYFIRGIMDGIRGRLSPDWILIDRTDSPAPEPRVPNYLKKGLWVRIMRWFGI